MTSGQQLLANRYSLIRQLAAGSYAETWLGNDNALDRYVAIKVLHPSDSDPDDDNQQFLREARIAASVSHPNIVAVFDAGEESDRPFLVMEWVNGDSLKQEILSSRRITPERALDVTAELLDGLSAIHAQGIIHRDIKPQNIMVNESGTIKLTDFGIARLITEGDVGADGMTAGSAAYMAPEQAQGLPVTPAADIYAAGIILYEMLTGRLPFRGDDPEQVLLQHINDPVLRPRRTNPSIPAQVEAIVLKALEKEPEKRFESAEEMRDALRIARRHLPIRRPVTLPTAESASEGRFPWQRIGLMAASLALIITAIAGATSLAVLDFGTSQTAAESENVNQADNASVTAEPSPAVTKEPTPAESVAPGGPPDPPYSAYENEFRIRGEVVVEGSSESEDRVNRPAPNRPATDDEAADDGEETTAQAAPPQPAPPPPPPPTPTPVPTQAPEPTATPEPVEDEAPDEDQSEGEPAAPGNSGDNPGQGDGSNSGSDNPGQGNGNGNGNGNNQSPDDDDPPATGQGQSNDDDDGSADPQSSDDDEKPEENDSDRLVASDNASETEEEAVDDDDEVADLNTTSSAGNDDDDAVDDAKESDDATSDDDDAAAADDDGDKSRSGSGSSSRSADDASNDDKDADLKNADDAEADSKTDARSSDDEDDDAEDDRDSDESEADDDEDKDKRKKTRSEPESERDRLLDRFLNRFTLNTAA
jgi:eukaryotic-like serine/threonine-protein kinase